MSRIKHKRGATFAWSFTITDPDGGGAAFDLTGWDLRCEAIGRDFGPPNFAARIVFTVNVLGAAGGVVEVLASSQDAEEWVLGDYRADFRLTQGAIAYLSDDWTLTVVQEQTEASNA